MRLLQRTAPQTESLLPAIGRWLRSRKASEAEFISRTSQSIIVKNMKQKRYILAVATAAVFIHSGLHAQNTPLNELQAVMDIAKSPTNNVSNLFSLASSTSFFQPSLTAAPTDWSLAITYAPVTTGGAGTAGSTILSASAIAITGYSINNPATTIIFTASNTLAAGEHVFVYGFPTSTFLNGLTFVVASATSTSFTASYGGTNHNGVSATENASALYDYPQWVALDANDNVYSPNADGYPPVGGGVSALAYNGTPNWTSVLNYGYCNPYMVAADVNGNVWMSSNQSSSSCGSSGVNLIAFSESSGSTTNGTPWKSGSSPAAVASTTGIAFDRSSNLWMGYNGACSSTVACIYEYKYNGTSSPQYATATASAPSKTTALQYIGPILVDSNYNVWISSEGTSASGTPYISVLPNSNTVASPAWGNAVLSTAMATGRNDSISMDSSNNVWAGSYTGSAADLNEVTPTYSTATVTSISSATNITAIPASSLPNQGEFDGDGTYWFPNGASTGVIFYYLPSTQVYIALTPCFLPHAATTCASVTGSSATFVTALATALPRALQVDSTGSIWVAASTGGQIVQIIGSAAPTWPQLSYAKFGIEPQ